jgi:hypothetical protein
MQSPLRRAKLAPPDESSAARAVPAGCVVASRRPAGVWLWLARDNAGERSMPSSRDPGPESPPIGAADPGLWGGYLPRPQGSDAILTRFYERPIDDRAHLQVWTYTDRLSYRPGDVVQVHASASVESVALAISRDDVAETPVERIACTVPFAMPADDFIERGCGWPVIARWRVPADLPSGFYVIRARASDAAGRTREQEHGFVVRAGRPGAQAPILLVAATSTWIAYNDWGGSCSYMADGQKQGFGLAPRLTIHRPWARGFIWLPENAPRKLHDFAMGPHDIPRYPQFEFAFNRGYSRYYANAGWACYERIFAHWAERNGYEFDLATQHDLHFDPELLGRYRCVVLVGHDEYWSWEMREALDRYVEGGGRVARFGGNFLWQVRLEDGGATQVCYSRLARLHDPLMGGAHERRVTTAWEDPLVGWPGAQSLGLNGCWGVYANFGTLVPRGTGGFTIYRPEHWSLAGSGLYYGDVLGARARIFGYEVDGLDHVMRDGLPYPTFADGAPGSTEIIGVGLAFNRETPRGARGEATYLPDETAFFALCRYGADTPENRERAARGTGMMVSFTRGAGAVFNAGTIDWVAGLRAATAEPATEIVTRNVLDRFSGRG